MEPVRLRRLSPRIWLVIAVAAVLVFALPGAAMADSTIGGVVRDSGATLIQGVAVNVYASSSGMIAGGPYYTAADGTYQTGVLPAGQYVLTFMTPPSPSPQYAFTYCGVASSVPWYRLVADPITVGDAPVTRDVVLAVGANVTVRVRRPLPNQNPVEGAYVALQYRSGEPMSNEPFTDGTTNVNGEVTFTNVFPGDWHVYVSDSGPAADWRFPDLWSPPTDPTVQYFTVAAGDLSALHDVEVTYLPIVTIVLPSGEGWQKEPSGGVAVDLQREPSDMGGSNLWYQDLPLGAPTNLGDFNNRTVNVTGEGEHQFVAYARLTDLGMTYGPVVMKYVRIDNTAPTSWSNADAKSHPFDIGASDALSGVAHRYYTVDGGPVTELTAAVTLPIGMHTVTWWAVDVAGNVEAAHSGQVASGPQPTMRRPYAPSPVRRYRYFSISGYMSRVRNHTTVTLLAYRWNGTAWVYKRSKKVYVHTPSSGLSRYYASWYLPTSGSWKIVARFNGGGGKVQAFSPARPVRVR